MLKIQHLTKQFGAVPLFTDLCMEVDAPVVLWAPSGWGKTTLLRILMGLERPTTGYCRLAAACPQAFRRAKAAGGAAAGAVGTQRHPAIGRALYRHGPGHLAAGGSAAAAALRGQAGVAGYPR